MKHNFITICLLLASCYFAKSQAVTTVQQMVKPKSYTLKLITQKNTINGYLSGINDSLLQLSTKRVAFSNSLNENSDLISYSYAQVEKVKIRRYGSVGRGIVFGALIGGGSGAIIGLVTYKEADPGLDQIFDFGPGFNAMIGGILGGISGAVIGGIIKSKSKQFLIRRNKKKFKDMSSNILQMALSNNVSKDSSENYVPPVTN